MAMFPCTSSSSMLRLFVLASVLLTVSAHSLPIPESQLDEIVARAIANRTTPGAAIAFGNKGTVLFSKTYGTIDYASAIKVTKDTQYDLASLTKVVGTTTAVMQLVQQKRIELKASVQKYISAWKYSNVTITNLLMHTSGLQADVYDWQQGLTGYHKYIDIILSLPLQYEPGTQVVYSDLNFILLGYIVEQVSGLSLDVYGEKNVWSKLGMKNTGYNPLHAVNFTVPENENCMYQYDSKSSKLDNIVYTEMDNTYRHTHVHGVVHDETACAMGGRAGHAGLFASIEDMSAFALMMINNGAYNNEWVVKAEIVRQFVSQQDSRWSRALGWETLIGISSGGQWLSTEAYGHTGFTGTNIWIDPFNELWFVLLTNRIDPTRNNAAAINSLRVQLADAISYSVLNPDAQSHSLTEARAITIGLSVVLFVGIVYMCIQTRSKKTELEEPLMAAGEDSIQHA